MIRFRERATPGPVVLAALLIALALSAHPAGIVSLAPVLVAAPQLFRWARRHVAIATVIVAASSALLTVLLFVGADLEQRRADAQTTRALSGSAGSLYSELNRYQLLSDSPYGTPIRRGAVVLIGLALLAYALRRWRSGKTVLNLPAAILGIGLLLLVATPSKWPSHFGTLVGLAALAIATEVAHPRRSPPDSCTPAYRRGRSRYRLVLVRAGRVEPGRPPHAGLDTSTRELPLAHRPLRGPATRRARWLGSELRGTGKSSRACELTPGRSPRGHPPW